MKNRFVAALCTLLLLWTSADMLRADDDPISAARSGGLYGIEPDLDRSLGNAQADAGQTIAWERYGIFFDEAGRDTFVAALKPGGAAVRQGAKVGDVVRLKSLVNTLQAFAQAETRKTHVVQLDVLDGDSGWQRDYRLTAPAADGTVDVIPPTLRNAATANPGLMAILRGNLSDSEADDIRRDALLALQALSAHAKGCHGAGAVAIPVQITVTTTTTDGFGTYKGSDTDAFGQVLRVRPEFAAWAQANIAAYPTGAISTVRSAVLEMISQEGCTGAGVRQLEAGLAEVMNTTLPETAEAPRSGAIPVKPDAFVASCYPLLMQDMRNRGHDIGERGSATICLCQEHAARASGDPALYSSLQEVDSRYFEANPDLHDAFNASFTECHRAPEGSDLRNRIEALWTRMNI